MIVITPMWPTKCQPNFGAFVKEACVQLEEFGHSLEVVAIKGRGVGFDKMRKHFFFLWDVLRTLVFSRQKNVYVHAPNYILIFVFLVVSVRRGKLIVNLHGNDLFPVTFAQRLVYRINCEVLKRVDGVVVPSEYFKKSFLDVIGDRFSSKVQVYPSGGVDERLFYFDGGVASQGSVVIGYVGRIDKGKGWDDFCSVVDFLIGKEGVCLEVVVVGDGAFREEMEVRLLPLEVRVVFTGMLEKEVLAEKFREIDLVILPSVLNESLGLCALEALASGCMVAAYNHAAIPEYIIENLNGVTANVGDKEALSQKVLDLIRAGRVKGRDREAIRSSVSLYFKSNVKKAFSVYFRGLK